MLPWSYILLIFWPTVVVFLFLSHHSLSLSHICVPRLFPPPFQLSSFRTGLAFFKIYFGLVFRCVCSCWDSVARTANGVAWISQVSLIISTYAANDWAFIIFVDPSMPDFAVAVEYVHFVFTPPWLLSILLSIHNLTRRQDMHTHSIIDIRFMNAVINFWACFVSCLSCVRLRRVITFFFLVSFFLVFFLSPLIFTFESVVYSRSVFFVGEIFLVRRSTASWVE